MTRKIKAQDVKPGMKVEFTHEGWTSSGIVDSVWTQGTQTWFYSQSNNARRYLSSNQEVTVLAEPQPDEPTEFGARVVVDGVQFIRRGGGSTYAWEASFGTCFTWDDLLRLGHVAVVPDQGWTVPADTPEVPDATEPRTWDRWEDVPNMVAVRSGLIADAFRRNGDRIERLISDNEWGSSILTANALNRIAPFTEVHDA